MLSVLHAAIPSPFILSRNRDEIDRRTTVRRVCTLSGLVGTPSTEKRCIVAREIMQPGIASIQASRRTCVPKELIFRCRDRATAVRSGTKTPERKYLRSIQYVCRRLRFFSPVSGPRRLLHQPMFYNRLRVCVRRLRGTTGYYILSLLPPKFFPDSLPTFANSAIFFTP